MAVLECGPAGSASYFTVRNALRRRLMQASCPQGQNLNFYGLLDELLRVAQSLPGRSRSPAEEVR